MPWGPSLSLLGAFSGLLGLSRAFLGLHQAQEGPEKVLRRLGEGPQDIVKLIKSSLTVLVPNSLNIFNTFKFPRSMRATKKQNEFLEMSDQLAG